MKIAVIGAGTLGCGWLISFARAGHAVRIFDSDPSFPDRVAQFLDQRLAALATKGLIDSIDQVRGLVQPAASLADALEDADFVQESVPEVVELKRTIFADLDRLSPSKAILSSSTSGMPPSHFMEHLAGRARCIVVHPLNPPYLNPAVEVVRSPWTSGATVDETCQLMEAIGQVPIRVEMEGRLVLTRLQGALLDEAFRMVGEGVASAEDIDKAFRDGLGLRYVFMGPFETMDLNAPGGLTDFVCRYGPMFTAMRREQFGAAADWPEAVVAKVDAERRRLLPLEQLQARQRWRDERLMEIAAYKRGMARS